MPPMRWNKAGYFGEKPPRKRYSHTIEQWIIHAAASACSSRASSRPSYRPSSAGSRSSEMMIPEKLRPEYSVTTWRSKSCSARI